MITSQVFREEPSISMKSAKLDRVMGLKGRVSMSKLLFIPAGAGVLLIKLELQPNFLTVAT